MKNINWRERFIAAGIHFGATLLVAALAAAIIFFVWFPGELSAMVGGDKLFLLVVACDLVLGPLMSLVIYSSTKPRRELIVDYAVIAAVQLAALLYGVYAVAQSRPAFIVFSVDRIEIVAALEFEDEDLAAGGAPEFRTRSWSGPRLASIELPTDVAERNELVFLGVSGKDVYLMPKYYRPYAAARHQVLEKSQPIAVLLQDAGAASESIERVVEKHGGADQIRWLLAKHRFGFAIAFIDVATSQPVGFLAVDPDWYYKRRDVQ